MDYVREQLGQNTPTQRASPLSHGLRGTSHIQKSSSGQHRDVDKGFMENFSSTIGDEDPTQKMSTAEQKRACQAHDMPCRKGGFMEKFSSTIGEKDESKGMR